jgi:MazG family protein
VASPPEGTSAALGRLDETTRRLRRECPWDREQDERSIVPHTVEEAYELADAAHSGDDAKLLDELGDVLFQVYFLSLLLEERGQGDLGAVAEHCRQKLIRRHPHIFGELEVASADEVLTNWDTIKRDQESGGSLFGDLPETLPATLYARKALRRAASAGHARPSEDELAQRLERQAKLLFDAADRDESFAAAGDLLLAAVELCRRSGADPELALRAATERFMSHTEEPEQET